MAYDGWVIGGVSPSWVVKSNGPDEKGLITLTCAANTRKLGGLDPRSEIEGVWGAMACSDITNTQLINGGTSVQCSDGDLVEVTDGVTTWTGALHVPEYTPDSMAKDLIEYTLKIEVELGTTTPPMKYVPPYYNYPDMEYYEWTDKSNTQSEEMTVYNAPFWVGSYPSYATDNGSGGGGAGWVNQNLIYGADGYTAHAYNDSSSVGGTKALYATGFHFNIPSDAKITRVNIRVHYANSSRLRPPYFNIAKHYLIVSGPGMNTEEIQNYIQGTDGGNLQDAWFDSADATLNPISTDPATYNSPDFTVRYSATLDRYKMAWVDYIQVGVWYIGEGQTEVSANRLDYGTELGYAKITSSTPIKRVTVYGSACCGPASLSCNGVSQQWHYSHETSTSRPGNTLPVGTEQLEWVFESPVDVVELESSTHLLPGDNCSNDHGCYLEYVLVEYS